MDDILAYVDRHREETVARLQALCRQPSIATQGVGMAEMAQLVRGALEDAGAQVELVPTAGYPIVVGRLAGTGPRTLMFYNHYDVQPPEPVELWDSPPFAAEVRDGHLYARGAADNKGNLVARLAAVEAWRAVRGELPVNILFVVEGEEEVGSPNLGRFAEEQAASLRADGCIWEAGYRDTRGRPEIYLGAKGILAVALLAFFVAPLSAGPTLIVLFLISLIGAYGLGFLFAGIALVFKRTQAMVGLVFSLMIFLTGALVGLESLGWIYQVFKYALPLTWGISLMRETLTKGENLVTLFQSGELIGLSIHSLIYLAVGLIVFTIGFWRARGKGTLAHI